jgi:predicted nucleotidyltransferase component of viral defense system
MIDLALIRRNYAGELPQSETADKYVLKEYIQLMILDYLSTSPYVKKIVFIGGTSLRLAKGIDRFSEDLDFDCKNLTEAEFAAMTDDVLRYLRRSGLAAEFADKDNPRLTAFRRNIVFPGLLFEMNLSGHRAERFLIKIEAQDQGVDYRPVQANIRRMGFFFPFPVPPDAVLCAMKISALLSRGKGRDFYDVMFLLGLTEPDYGFLSAKCDIGDKAALKTALVKAFDDADMGRRSRDFAHLAFGAGSADKLLRFRYFVETM